jgi:hypothetical protein
MVTTMAFLQYYMKSSTKRGWEMSSLLVAIQAILQMDQTTSTYQELLWYLRERRQVANLDFD